MQTIKQKLALARWRDKSFVYHPASGHHDASEFRDRMRAYAKPQAAGLANVELVQITRGGKR